MTLFRNQTITDWVQSKIGVRQTVDATAWTTNEVWTPDASKGIEILVTGAAPAGVSVPTIANLALGHGIEIIFQSAQSNLISFDQPPFVGLEQRPTHVDEVHYFIQRQLGSGTATFSIVGMDKVGW